MNQIETGPLISVLMTSYNREKYIHEAIESVLASTYKNFELIIVDDCSKDRTVEIARKYEVLDQRIKVFINEKNLGDYPNRNKAACYASGKYLKYVDADDYLYPNGLESIINLMEKYPEASVGLFSLPQNTQKPFPILLDPSEAYMYNFFAQGLFHKAPLSSIFRKDSFDEIGGFSLIRHAGDFDMWHKMAQKLNFLLIQDHVVWFREHDDQESKKHNVQVELNYTRIEKKYVLDENSPLTSIQRNSILKRRINMYLKQLVIYLVKMDYRNALLLQKRIFIYLGWKK
jgi:glycosyltransferase involved in cell wall biosynthesis